MDLIPLIGFGIGFLALIYIFAKKRIEERLSHENPKEWERKQAEGGDTLKKLLRNNVFDEEKRGRHPAKLQKVEQATPSANAPAKKVQLPSVPLLKPIAAPKVSLQAKSYNVAPLIRNTQRIREGMILKEILSPPRALKLHDFSDK